MKKNTTTTLDSLFINELSNLYKAEHRILKILPIMIKSIESVEFRETLENHLEQTVQHVTRLEKIFSNKRISPLKKKCAVMEDLAEECASLIKVNADSVIKDIAILFHLEKIEHYEIAAYGCAVTYAKVLEEFENRDILQATLDEEIETDEILSEIAIDSLTENAIEKWEEEQVL